MTRSGLFRAAAALGLAPLAKHVPTRRVSDLEETRRFAKWHVELGEPIRVSSVNFHGVGDIKALEAEIVKRARMMPATRRTA